MLGTVIAYKTDHGHGTGSMQYWEQCFRSDDSCHAADGLKYDCGDLCIMDTRCPRCESETVELGEKSLEIGVTRKDPVSIRLCGNCGMVFYVHIEKISKF
uniref:Uncharacterized protein n=1 Tax=Candidatus Methanogaster sp. ANME-2c ERB4 TaxID=2759911 RepID=A0A7G9YKN0_9EURY|nr:hypothetical protein JAJEHNPH_00024 [Methanosarcinales archaeon ANME-2c ERB4]QNO48929.1 hypothetical protein OEPDFBKK_00004 [Methanosarcinales archaeon ANME-2c ERB4]